MGVQKRLMARSATLSLIVSLLASPVSAATVPAGFSDELVTSGLTRPTAMAFAPNGRLFVAEQDGALRVIRNGVLLAAPFVTLTVDSVGERGLLGVAVDRAFGSNRFVYVYHTVPGSPAHNRVTRFTANGDTAAVRSAKVLLDLDFLSVKTNHNGGNLQFGQDGKLYVFVGENGNRENSQSLATRLGKVLRINKDGTFPATNPTSFDALSGTTSRVNKAIWAVGLRNPFTAAFQKGTGKLFINDVGADTWEEINLGTAGANYGWPATEGPTIDPEFTSPVYAYQHGSNDTFGCAITGGTFYNPQTAQFPASYVGKYFYADFCGGWIHYIDPKSPVTAEPFAEGIIKLVDMKTKNGMLYYLFRGVGVGGGGVGRIRYTAPH